MKRRGFTLMELIIVITIMAMVFMGGCYFLGSFLVSEVSEETSERAGLVSNPYAKSTATIQVQTAYAMAGEFANTYRVFANVLESSDGWTGEETFEISDSILDGNFSTADLFGRMKSKEGKEETIVVQCRGERSGLRSTFRQITGIVQD